MNKTLRVLFGFLMLVVLLGLSPGGRNLVFAQTAVPVPQKVIAINNFVIPEGEDCAGLSYEMRLEVWNVGSAAGDLYGAATMTATGYSCMDGKPFGDLKTGHYSGTFSGGPNGTVRLTQIFTGDTKELNQDYVNHVYVLRFINGKQITSELRGEFIVQNPEAFEGAEPPEVTATPGVSCTPSVGGLTGLKPGDTLSPSVEFFDPAGKPVAPLSAVWYINGKQTYSITWNGEAVSLELQYTCPDNAARSKRYAVPAYAAEQPPDSGQAVVPPPAQAPEEPPAEPPADQQDPADQPPAAPDDAAPAPPSPGKVDPAVAVGVGMAVLGVAGVVVSGGVIISSIPVLGGAPKPVPSASPPVMTQPVSPDAAQPSSPVVAQPVLPAAAQPASPVDPPVQTTSPSSDAAPSTTPDQAGQTEPAQESESKDVIDTIRETTEKYSGKLNDASEKLNTLKENLENEDKVLPPEVRDRIVKFIESCDESINKVKESVEGIGEKANNLNEIKQTIRNLDEQVKQIMDTREKIKKEVEKLPPGQAHQLTDLTTFIDATVRGADSLIQKVPGAEQIIGKDLVDSTQEGIKGLGKAMKVLHTSDTTAKEVGDLKEFDDSKDNSEIDKVRKEFQTASPPGFIDKVKDWARWFAGVKKPADPKIIQFR
jgi:hypothetical protein